MIRRLAWALSAPLILANVFLAPGTAAVAGNSLISASPSVGHSGDFIYLSGSGFAPHHQLRLFMMCPPWNINARAAYLYGNYTAPREGPTTDAHGTFTAYRFQILTLHELKGSGCAIYDESINPFGPDIPGSLEILPPGQLAPVCEQSICLKVQAHPTHVHYGLSETITIQSSRESWAGARAIVTVRYPKYVHYPAVTYPPLTLDTNGTAAKRISIPIHTSQPVSAKVEVSVHLGSYRGARATGFTVVR